MLAATPVIDAAANVKTLRGRVVCGTSMLTDQPALLSVLRLFFARRLAREEDRALGCGVTDGPESLADGAGSTATGSTTMDSGGAWFDAVEQLGDGDYGSAFWVVTPRAWLDAFEASTAHPIADPAAGTILGRPAIIVPGPAHAAGVKVGALAVPGALSVVDRGDRLLVLRERLAESGKVEIRAHRRIAATVTAPESVVALQLAV